MKTFFFALSLGPIVPTLLSARKTREVWGASYAFSKIVEEMVIKLDTPKSSNVLSPRLITRPESAKGAGLYPELIIWSAQYEPTENEALILETTKVAGYLNSIWGESFPTNIGQILRAPLICLGTGKNLNYFTSASDRVSALERAFLVPEGEFRWFYEVAGKETDPRDKKKWRAAAWVNSLVKNTFSEHKRLRSLIEVAAGELEELYTSAESFVVPFPDERDTVWRLLQPETPDNDKDTREETDLGKLLFEKYGDKFLLRHKYLAVVQGDGDAIGNDLIKPFGNKPDKVKLISTALAEFAAEAATQIANYGGQPIYTGGDDLLFFAPLLAHPGKATEVLAKAESKNVPSTLPALLRKLSDDFCKKITDLTNGADWKVDGDSQATAIDSASTSFGVHIMHYKQPLDQAMKSAQSLLFEKAKTTKDKYRPVVAWKLEMHSNAPSTTTLMPMKGDNNSSWLAFEQLIEDVRDHTMEIIRPKTVRELAPQSTAKEYETEIESIGATLQHKQMQYLEYGSLLEGMGFSSKSLYDRMIRKRDPDTETAGGSTNDQLERFIEADRIASGLVEPMKPSVQAGTVQKTEQEKENNQHTLDLDKYKTWLKKQDAHQRRVQFVSKFAQLLQRKDESYES